MIFSINIKDINSKCVIECLLLFFRRRVIFFNIVVPLYIFNLIASNISVVFCTLGNCTLNHVFLLCPPWTYTNSDIFLYIHKIHDVELINNIDHHKQIRDLNNIQRRLLYSSFMQLTCSYDLIIHNWGKVKWLVWN